MSHGSGEFTWDDGPATDGPAPVTTIAWRLGPVIECLASMYGTHFGGPVTDVETFPYPRDGAPELRELVEIHRSCVVLDHLEQSEEALAEAVQQEARSLLDTGG